MGNKQVVPEPPEDAKYELVVKSGIVKGGHSRRHRISLRLFDGRGGSTTTKSIPIPWSRGHCNGIENIVFMKDDQAELGELLRIDISREKWRKRDAWYLYWIRVRHLKDEDRDDIMFPVHRFIEAKKTVIIYANDCFLPQADKRTDQRRKEVARKRRAAHFHCICNGVPAQAAERPSWDFYRMPDTVAIKTRRKTLMKDADMELVNKAPIKTMRELQRLYRAPHVPPSKCMKYWQTDAAFGQMRLSGCNPMAIKRCKVLPVEFAVDNNQVKSCLQGLTLDEAMRNDRIYIVDYRQLEVVRMVGRFKMVSPIAQFYVEKNAGRLMPIAIQLQFSRKFSYPMFFPSDPYWTWQVAKMWFNVADMAHHLAVTKYMQTNLIGETFALAIHRNLNVSHPLFQLVAPHIACIFANNRINSYTLMDGNRGWIDDVAALGRMGVYSAVRAHYIHFNLEMDSYVPNNLAARGVADPRKLPHYYYRDDAVLVWSAIHNYVATVCEIFYKTPDDLRLDNELQLMALELCTCVSEESTRLRGVPIDGKFETLDQVVDLFTCIIYTCSGHFGATNNGIYEQIAYWPNCPVSILGEPPRFKEALTEADVNKMLPPCVPLINSVLMARLLSNRAVAELGNYEIEYLFHPVARYALKKFRADLQHINEHIESQNAQRLAPYTALMPKNIPNCMFT